MSEETRALTGIKKMLGEIDRLLRGGFTRREDLREGRIDVPVRTLVRAGLILGGSYGVMMGLYSLGERGFDGLFQLIATTAKVPLLFLLTLVVTLPSLYVFSALSGTRLRAPETVKLLLAAIGVNLAVLASFGPVTAFFTVLKRGQTPWFWDGVLCRNGLQPNPIGSVPGPHSTRVGLRARRGRRGGGGDGGGCGTKKGV